MKAIARTAARGAWAIADQGVVSLGNFLTAILLARALPTAEYGLLALILGGIIVLNTVHGALVIYPLTISTARKDLRRARPLVTAAMVGGAGVSLLIGGLGSLGLVFTGHVAVVLPALAALLAWQCQETARTGLVAHMRFSEALIGDGLSYLGQAAALLVLIRAHYATVTSALVLVAVTSILGATVQIWQLRLPIRFRGRVLRVLVARSIRDGRWLLGTRLLGIWTGQGFSWALAYRFGAASVGSFQALLNVLAFSHPVLFGTGNAITAAVAARAQRGRSRLLHAVTPFCLILVGLLIPYFVFILIAPESAISLYYGSTSPLMENAHLLRGLVVAYLSLLAVTVPSAILTGVSKTRPLFIAQCAGAVSTVLWGIPMTLRFGLFGATVGVAGVNIAQAAICLTALAGFLRSGRRQPAGQPRILDAYE